jgi:signal transduction histidine kinase
MMGKKVVLHVRDPFLLDASTYVSTAVMALLGVSGLPSLVLQIISLLLCLTFVLVYQFLFRTGYYQRNPVLYFGIQLIVLVMLLLLRSEANDAYNFLFYILTVHTAVVLHLRTAIAWTILYFIVAAAFVLVSRGMDGLYAVFFYLATFVVCFIFGYVIQQTELTSERNQRLVEELQVTQTKLQELAVVEERNRLARDLHDSVKQQVYAISMQLGAARTLLEEVHPSYSPVVEAERLAQQAGVELTTLIRELRPPSLERKTLAQALQDYITDWARRNNIETSINIDDDLSLSATEEDAFFRVVQEALSNILRHGQATQVRVELIKVDSDVLFSIVDTGKGFDMDHAPLGVGLQSMRERLAQIGATFQVQSEPGHGTQITSTLKRA